MTLRMNTIRKNGLLEKFVNMKKEIVQDVYDVHGLWDAVSVLIEFEGYVKVGKMIGVSYGYMWHVLSGNSEPSQKIVDRAQASLVKWLEDGNSEL